MFKIRNTCIPMEDLSTVLGNRRCNAQYVNLSWFLHSAVLLKNKTNITLVIIFIVLVHRFEVCTSLWNCIYIPYFCNFSVFVVVIFQIICHISAQICENLFFFISWVYLSLCVKFEKIQSNGCKCCYCWWVYRHLCPSWVWCELNTTVATIGAGTSNPSDTSEFTPYFVVWYVLFDLLLSV